MPRSTSSKKARKSAAYRSRSHLSATHSILKPPRHPIAIPPVNLTEPRVEISLLFVDHEPVEEREGDGEHAEVEVAIDPAHITAAITRGSVEHLALKEGDEVIVIIKSTEVMVGKE